MEDLLLVLKYLWILFVGLAGFIIKQLYVRLEKMEVNHKENSKNIAKQWTQLEVNKEKLEGFERVVDSKLESIAKDVTEIKALLRDRG